MADTDSSTTAESPAQKQARERRERRNAKIQAGGSERLNKITSMSGRPAAAEAVTPSSSPKPQPSPAPKPALRPSATDDDDPAEVDISQMFQRPPGDMTADDQQALLRQMLGSGGPQPPPGGAPGQMPGDEGDPMAQMMQQLLQGTGMEGSGGGLPAGLSAMLGGQQQQEEGRSDQYIWRIIHAMISFAIGVYAAFFMSFTGSEFERTSSTEQGVLPRIFYMFVTAELVLQTSRYFMDKGRLPTSGMLMGLGQMLPEPISGYLRLISRYSIIWTTIVSDAMVIVFILGCMTWWHGGALPAS